MATEPKKLREDQNELVEKQDKIKNQYDHCIERIEELRAQCDQDGFQMIYHMLRKKVEAANVQAAEVDKKDVDGIKAQVALFADIVHDITQPLRDLSSVVADSMGTLWAIEKPRRFEFNQKAGQVKEK